MCESSTQSRKMEWVEIIEPRTKEHMYANLTTGECVWDPPPGVPVKKTDNNQWWELFDHNTSRFYYYNATSQKTVWHRPTDCDIIPLAKLQTLKQNTEPAGGGTDGLASGDDGKRMGEYRKKESVSTQTQTPSAVRAAAARFNHQESPNAASTLQVGAPAGRICKPRVSGSGVGTGDSQTSPSSPSPSPSSRRQHHHHHHHYHHQHNNRHHRYQEEPTTRKHHNNSQDSGRSSDSSISHSRTSLESSTAYRLLDSPHRHQQRSSLGQQTPTGGLPPPPPPPTTSNRSVATHAVSTGNTMESRSQNRSGTLENTKNVKVPSSLTESAPPLGLSLSTSTPLFKKKSFVDQQQAGGVICHRERRTQKNGRESSSRGSYGPEPSTSPYRDSAMEPRGFRQEMPPYRPPEVQQQQFQSAHGYKSSQSTDKYGSLVESSNRYHRERERERELLHHRDRVNSLDKSANSSSGFYSSSVHHGRNLNKSEAPSNVATGHGDIGSIGRKHRGCSASLSEANVREMYGVMLSDRNEPNKGSLARDRANALLGSGNVIRQKSLEVSERNRDRDRPNVLDRQQVDTGKTTSASNNSLDATSQPLARSYSFVQQQQKQQQQHHHHHHHHQPSRRRNRDDDSMHERYLIGQTHDPSRLHRLAGGSSNSTSSNSSNSSDSSNSSCNSAIGEDIRGHTEIEDYGKKKPSNGNPSPPPSPYYGNLLVDADHLLPLQHYILEQAKLSGCYKFGDPLFGVEEGDDSLDEESGSRGGYGDDSRLGGRADSSGGGIGSRAVSGTTGRPDDDSDDQFADDEAASNQGDSSSQEYLEDHYADLGNYDTAGLATYYNTAETLTRPQTTTCVPPIHVSTSSVPTMGTASAASAPSTATTTLCTGSSNAAASSHGGELRAEGTSSLTNPRPISLPPSSAFTSLVMGKGIDTNDAGSGGGDIEKYAQDNLNLNCGRPKGLRLLFRKKFSVRDILSWSKDPIPQPMLVVVDGEKLLKREACNLFRLVQVYMGDRKANVGMTLDGVATDIVNTAFSKPPLRDELYVQICRQTTENPRKESLRRGWELMAVCLAFVPPSATFEPYLEGYMNRHRDPNFQFPEVAKWPIHVQVSHYATVACKRLQRIGAHGKRQPRKATIEDIDQARIQIFRASMFGATLSEVMALQRDRFPDRELPWVQTTLTRQVLVRGGTLTEGIFRVSADADEVSTLKSCLDRFEDGANLAASQDAHAPASLLKLWVRELYEPLIPDSFYAECVSMRHDDGEASASSVAALVERLADLNRRVLCHLIRFLQIFARPEVVARTKMDANNLAMVMAPNILRCTSQDPRVILENARKEMAFVRTLIESLDTSWVDDLH